MAKNERKKGKSARNGNKPAPYTKYTKAPFPYGQDYKRNVLVSGIFCRASESTGKPIPVMRHTKHKLEAAE